MKVLALITARGGSVALPRKNVLPFCGKPLIAYSIEAAEGARRAGAPIDRIIVSTDDAEIAEISRRHGAEVPFMRPAELARPIRLPLPSSACPVLRGGQAAATIGSFCCSRPRRCARRKTSATHSPSRATPETTAVIGVTSANASHPAKLKHDRRRHAAADSGQHLHRSGGKILPLTSIKPTVQST